VRINLLRYFPFLFEDHDGKPEQSEDDVGVHDPTEDRKVGEELLDPASVIAYRLR